MWNAQSCVEWQADVRGLHCPMPVIRCRASLAQMAVGDVLSLRATDRDARREIEALIATLGHQILSIYECTHGVEFVIRKLQSVHCAAPVYSARYGQRGWSELARACTRGLTPVTAD